MTSSRVEGTFRSRRFRRTAKIWESIHDTGAYGYNDTVRFSKISIYVPQPRNGEHAPGVFVRLSNPAGSALARLTPAELSALGEFILSVLQPATTAYNEAHSQIQIYQEAERTLILNKSSTTSTPLDEIEDYDGEVEDIDIPPDDDDPSTIPSS